MEGFGGQALQSMVERCPRRGDGQVVWGAGEVEEEMGEILVKALACVVVVVVVAADVVAGGERTSSVVVVPLRSDDWGWG